MINIRTKDEDFTIHRHRFRRDRTMGGTRVRTASEPADETVKLDYQEVAP